MKKNIRFFYVLILIAVSMQCMFSQTVTLNGYQLFVDGQRYRINGICYSRGNTGNYADDIALLKEANINTIRTYSPITDSAEIDAFADAGIKIIMHLNENNYIDYIIKYKNHPAILMWEFGNEFNYHPEWFDGDLNIWYTMLEACAIKAKELDPTRPVTTAHGEVPTPEVLDACPSVDVWGLNLYRYDNDVPAIKEFTAISRKAMYVSEAGADSYNKKLNDIDEYAQAKAVNSIVPGIINEFDICIGVTVFEFCDEWWKAGEPLIQNLGKTAPNSSGVPYDGSADEEYWGIVRQDRTKKPAYFELKRIYTGISEKEISPMPEIE